LFQRPAHRSGRKSLISWCRRLLADDGGRLSIAVHAGPTLAEDLAIQLQSFMRRRLRSQHGQQVLDVRAKTDPVRTLCESLQNPRNLNRVPMAAARRRRHAALVEPLSNPVQARDTLRPQGCDDRSKFCSCRDSVGSASLPSGTASDRSETVLRHDTAHTDERSNQAAGG
jgi:hypothetical protein